MDDLKDIWIACFYFLNFYSYMNVRMVCTRFKQYCKYLPLFIHQLRRFGFDVKNEMEANEVFLNEMYGNKRLKETISINHVPKFGVDFINVLHINVHYSSMLRQHSNDYTYLITYSTWLNGIHVFGFKNILEKLKKRDVETGPVTLHIYASEKEMLIGWMEYQRTYGKKFICLHFSELDYNFLVARCHAHNDVRGFWDRFYILDLDLLFNKKLRDPLTSLEIKVNAFGLQKVHALLFKRTEILNMKNYIYKPIILLQEIYERIRGFAIIPTERFCQGEQQENLDKFVLCNGYIAWLYSGH